MINKLKAALSRGIETLYLRYVWPQRMPAEWTPQAQMESLRLDHANFFRSRWEVGMSLDSCGPLGEMLADLVRMLIVDKHGKPAPNYCEAQIKLDQWVKLEGEHAERATITIQRCKGQTPHQMKAAAEAELRQQKLANNELRNECTRLTEELAAAEREKKAFTDAAQRAKEELLEADVQRVELATKLDNLRETWAKTVKANGELGTATTEALCEIDELRAIIWHFSTRASMVVGDAMKQLDEPQREKLQVIWRKNTSSGMYAHAASVGAAAAAVAINSTMLAAACTATTQPQPPTGAQP